ncbi:MAG: general secretion pathway protein GspK [Candidatus Omnitrophica bacterium]|nr:general secretion pathway protein GspK [Candidatus Omnitrophota bacterium]
MKNRLYRSHRGSILILTLWTLTLLTIFAVNIGLRVRQRVFLISRIENRGDLHFMAQAGVKKAIAVLRRDLTQNAQIYTSAGKASRHNNTYDFKEIHVGRGMVQVGYALNDVNSDKKEIKYGFQDEERKININQADRSVLKSLMLLTATTDDNQAAILAEAIIEWREPGLTQLEGFNSEGYYATLEFPYEIKDYELEVIEELLQIRGFTPEVFQRLKPFITIYGDGLVNINTAPKTVLMALGLSSDVADKVISVRNGVDEIESTGDDYIFYKTYDIASEMASFINLNRDDIAQIDSLNASRKIKTNSVYFYIESTASINPQKPSKNVQCVYNSIDNLIVYWREK